MNPEIKLLGKGYSEFRYLGKGEQGIVLLAKEQKTNRRYAIKGVRVRDNEGKTDFKRYEQVLQEINMLNSCKGSPYVVNLIDQIDGKEFIYLVLTECQGKNLTHSIATQYFIFLIGTLSDIIEQNQNKKLNELSAIKYSKDIAEGLYYIHSKKCIINDLKMDNILIDYNGNAVVSDFGLAQSLPKMSGYGMSEYVKYFISSNIQSYCFNNQMGNVYFVEPECIDPKEFKKYNEEYKKRGLTTQTKPSQRVFILLFDQNQILIIFKILKYRVKLALQVIKLNTILSYLSFVLIGYLIYTMVQGMNFEVALNKHLALQYDNDFSQFIYQKQLKYIIDGLTQFNPRDRISIKEVLILLKGILSFELKLDEQFNELMDDRTQEILNQISKQIEFVQHFSNKYYPIMQFLEIKTLFLILFFSKNENSLMKEIQKNIEDEQNKKYNILEIQYNELLQIQSIQLKKIEEQKKQIFEQINQIQKLEQKLVDQNKFQKNHNIKQGENSHNTINEEEIGTFENKNLANSQQKVL